MKFAVIYLKVASYNTKDIMEYTFVEIELCFRSVRQDCPAPELRHLYITRYVILVDDSGLSYRITCYNYVQN